MPRRTERARGQKYRPLAAYLAACVGERVTLSVTMIEAILGRPLPASAQHPGWWHNRPFGYSHARAWLDVGWRTLTPARGSGVVTFVR